MTELRALLRFTLLATVVAVAVRGDAHYAVFCLAALTGVTLAGTWGLRRELEVAALAVMAIDMTLGNALGLYRQLPWLDKALHLLGAALFGAIAYGALRRWRLPAWLACGAIVLVTLGLGALWEIGEYGVDRALGRTTQTAPGMAPLDDTMLDLALDAAGGALGVMLTGSRRTMGG